MKSLNNYRGKHAYFLSTTSRSCKPFFAQLTRPLTNKKGFKRTKMILIMLFTLIKIKIILPHHRHCFPSFTRLQILYKTDKNKNNNYCTSINELHDMQMQN